MFVTSEMKGTIGLRGLGNELYYLFKKRLAFLPPDDRHYLLLVSWMFSAMTEVLYISAHSRFEIAAPFGSSLRIRAALLVEDTLIRSTPFKCLSNHASHCPNASKRQKLEHNRFSTCGCEYIRSISSNRHFPNRASL